MIFCDFNQAGYRFILWKLRYCKYGLLLHFNITFVEQYFIQDFHRLPGGFLPEPENGIFANFPIGLISSKIN